jgi:Tol biopolymer transport system component
VNEQRVQSLLRAQRAPDEQAAEERALRLVRAAYAQRTVPVRGRPRRLALGLAIGIAAIAAALTPPGQAVADWVRDAVRPGRDDARPALASLPAQGRLLVTSEQGVWVVNADGSKRLLAGYDDASWSPHGLFVAATRGRELLALEPGGRPRWSLARDAPVTTPRWSDDGFRIAYRSGDDLRVVAGDGTGDALLAHRVAPTAPAWLPGAHRLAYVDRRGRIVLADADSGKRAWRSRAVGRTNGLAWSGDGARLLALSAGRVRLLDGRGHLRAAVAMPPGARAEAAAFRPGDRSFALLSYAGARDRSRLELIDMDGGEVRNRRLLAGVGRFGDLAWAPDGRWLLAGWRDADQWVFIRTGAASRAAIERLRAVGNISSQFHPGEARMRFPGLAGWCCAP